MAKATGFDKQKKNVYIYPQAEQMPKDKSHLTLIASNYCWNGRKDENTFYYILNDTLIIKDRGFVY